MTSDNGGTEKRLTTRILFAMVLGMGTGVIFGQSLVPLGVAGKLFIQLIKVMAVPLVFFSIVDALITTKITWLSARKLLIVVLVNTSIALLIGLSLSNLVKPGAYFERSVAALPGGESPKIESIDLGIVL